MRCWHAKTDGWAASTFHSNCDGKGPTVTIVQVGSYIFGGYTDKSWGGKYQFTYTDKSWGGKYQFTYTDKSWGGKYLVTYTDKSWGGKYQFTYTDKSWGGKYQFSRTQLVI